MSSDTKVWFITGCSSGFGLCITEHALQKGDKVVATLRKPEILSDLAERYPKTLLVLRLDVTELAAVTAAFAAGREKFGRIDVVVNNAASCMLTEVEGTTDGHARGLFEVNFWGASYVSREAVRFFREENKPVGGRLLQISSSVGIQPMASMAYYSASKFALEAFSEGLADELHPDWNIKVTILEPGPFRTNVAKGSLIVLPVHPAYTDPSLPSMKSRDVLAHATSTVPFNGDPVKFAKAVYKAAYLEDPPRRLPLHPLSIGIFRKRGKHLLETAEKWESWSEDLLIEGCSTEGLKVEY